MTNYHPDWKRVAGAQRDYVDATLAGIDNLDAITSISADVWNVDGASAAVPLTGVILDSATRKVRIELDTWLQSAAAPDTYYLRIYLHDAAGSKLPWGEDEPMVLEVQAAAPTAAP